MGTILADLIEKSKALVSKCAGIVTSRLRTALIIAAAVLVLALLLLVLALVRSRSPKTETAQSGPALNRDIPSLSTEDFFLPYEPDFVPDVLLEREPRDGWTEEDARPFWTDPMEGNEEAWRRRIEGGVDSLLEHVP